MSGSSTVQSYAATLWNSVHLSVTRCIVSKQLDMICHEIISPPDNTIILVSQNKYGLYNFSWRRRHTQPLSTDISCRSQVR